MDDDADDGELNALPSVLLSRVSEEKLYGI